MTHNPLATVSLLMGLLSALLFAAPFAAVLRYGSTPPPWFYLVFPLAPLATPWLPALLGIICGRVSRRQMKWRGAHSGERGRAAVGLILSYTLLAINLVVAGMVLLVYLALG
jgi:hypothetical protein